MILGLGETIRASEAGDGFNWIKTAFGVSRVGVGPQHNLTQRRQRVAVGRIHGIS